MTTITNKVKAIAEDISKLTLLETADLTSYLKDQLNIPDHMLTGGAVAMAAAPVAAEAPAAAEEKTEFSVILKSFGDGKKIGVIKAIRSLTGASLGDAKKIAEDLVNAPYEIKASVSKADADVTKQALEEAGGVVELK
jgi:large subunit ribosomal protein L7/L12